MEQVNPCWQGRDRYMPSGNNLGQDTFPSGHLGLVQDLGLGLAPLGDLLLLGLEL